MVFGQHDVGDRPADQLAGRVAEQLGHPADIYELPRTVFVANFLGQSNLIEGRRAGTSGDDQLVEGGLAAVCDDVSRG